MKKVGLIMGSDSDLPVAKKAMDTLKEFGIPFEVHVLSAHRTHDETMAFSMTADENKFGVIIAFAGMAAHLAGIIAANTVLPVIGVPVKTDTLGGIDALLSTVQMPGGVPVATVGVNGAKNAALLAVEILSIDNAEMKDRMWDYRDASTVDIVGKDMEIHEQYSWDGTVVDEPDEE